MKVETRAPGNPQTDLTRFDCPIFAVYETEPLTKLLSKFREKTRDWSEACIFLSMCVVYFVVPALLSLIEGTAFDKDPNKLAFFDDYLGIFNYALVYPLLHLLILRYFESIPLAFDSLLKGGIIIGEEQKKYRDFLRLLRKAYNTYWINITAILLVAPVLVWYHKQFIAVGALLVYGGGGSGHLTLLGWYWLYLVSGTVFYAIVSAGLRHFVTIRAIWQLSNGFSFDIHLRHHDKCGGLGALGNIFVNLAWVAVLLGMLIASYTGLSAVTGFQYSLLNYRFVASLMLYILMAPGLIFVPLWRLHKKMEYTRQRQLNKISASIHGNYRRILYAGFPGSFDSQSIDALQDLDKLFEIVARLPVWPVNFGSARVIVTATSMFLAPIVTSWLKAVLGL